MRNLDLPLIFILAHTKTGMRASQGDEHLAAGVRVKLLAIAIGLNTRAHHIRLVAFLIRKLKILLS